jgi:hypothetical protein
MGNFIARSNVSMFLPTVHIDYGTLIKKKKAFSHSPQFIDEHWTIGLPQGNHG